MTPNAPRCTSKTDITIHSIGQQQQDPEPGQLDQGAAPLVATRHHGCSSIAWPDTSSATAGPPMPERRHDDVDGHLDAGAPSMVTSRAATPWA